MNAQATISPPSPASSPSDSPLRLPHNPWHPRKAPKSVTASPRPDKTIADGETRMRGAGRQGGQRPDGMEVRCQGHLREDGRQDRCAEVISPRQNGAAGHG